MPVIIIIFNAIPEASSIHHSAHLKILIRSQVLGGGKNIGFRVRQTCAKSLAPPFPSCMSLVKLPSFSEPQVPYEMKIRSQSYCAFNVCQSLF